MNAITLNRLMGVSVEYSRNGSTLKRRVKAGQAVGKNGTMLLVETENENGDICRQWVDVKFFESWLNQVSDAA